MYFVYVDETGTDGESPVMVMVGVVANSERLTRTTSELAKIFTSHAALTTKQAELKAKHLFAGNGPWRSVCGADRNAVVTELCEWFVERKHELALAAIDIAAFRKNPPSDSGLEDLWQAGALHVALQVQRLEQVKKGSKGMTVLVFDDNKVGVPRLAELVYEPPSWTDSYYDRKPKSPALDRIIDTPFAVKSHHVGLIQVADVFAHIFRRYSELADFGCQPKYADEAKHYQEWVSRLAPRLINRAHRWPTRTQSPCTEWYANLAPNALKQLK